MLLGLRTGERMEVSARLHFRHHHQANGFTFVGEHAINEHAATVVVQVDASSRHRLTHQPGEQLGEDRGTVRVALLLQRDARASGLAADAGARLHLARCGHMGKFRESEALEKGWPEIRPRSFERPARL
jgi:hypothetical protein